MSPVQNGTANAAFAEPSSQPAVDVTKIFNDVGQTDEFITARDALIQAHAAARMNATLETSHVEDAESDFNNAMRMLGSYMIPTMQRQVDQRNALRNSLYAHGVYLRRTIYRI